MSDGSTPGGGAGTSPSTGDVQGQPGNPPAVPISTPSPPSASTTNSTAAAVATASASTSVNEAAPTTSGALTVPVPPTTQAQAASSPLPPQQPYEGPPLPPRTYSRDPRLLTYRPAPPPKLPSQALPKFFNFLAYFILITGSSATLLAFLYRTYLYPKLALLKARLTSLHRHDLSLYDKFLLSIHSLVEGQPKIFANTKQLIEYRRQPLIVDPTAEISLPGQNDQQVKDVEKELAREDSSAPDVSPTGEAARDEEEQSEESQTRQREVNNITSDLQDSLSRLADRLSAYANRDKPMTNKLDSELPEPTPSQLLSKSLESFTAKLTNETFHSSSPSYPSTLYGGYNYAAGGATGSGTIMSGMDKDLMVKVKNDIRMLKGMFLTRRNFATPSKVEIEAS